MATIAIETVVRLGPEDSASLIPPDTSLARALKFPAGHWVWCIWRPATQDHDFFDATCTVLSGAQPRKPRQFAMPIIDGLHMTEDT